MKFHRILFMINVKTKGYVINSVNVFLPFPMGVLLKKGVTSPYYKYFRFVNIFPDRAIFALCSNQFIPSRVISCDEKKPIIAVFDTCTLAFIKIYRIAIFPNAFGFHTFFRRYSIFLFNYNPFIHQFFSKRL